jgi:hypothetical protein
MPHARTDCEFRWLWQQRLPVPCAKLIDPFGSCIEGVGWIHYWGHSMTKFVSTLCWTECLCGSTQVGNVIDSLTGLSCWVICSTACHGKDRPAVVPVIKSDVRFLFCILFVLCLICASLVAVVTFELQSIHQYSRIVSKAAELTRA